MKTSSVRFADIGKLLRQEAPVKALSSVAPRPTIVSQTKSEYSPKLPYALRPQRLAVDVDLAVRETKKQSYIDQLRRADSLVQQAMDLLSRPHAGAGFAALGGSGLVDWVLAQSLMAEASQIRQSVANNLPADLQRAIKDADALEQQAFLKVQSNDPYVVSDGATDLKMGMERFSLIEQDISKRDIGGVSGQCFAGPRRYPRQLWA